VALHRWRPIVRAAHAAGDRSSEQGKLLARLSMSVRPEAHRTREDLPPPAAGDVRVRHAAVRGLGDDLPRLVRADYAQNRPFAGTSPVGRAGLEPAALG